MRYYFDHSVWIFFENCLSSVNLPQSLSVYQGSECQVKTKTKIQYETLVNWFKFTRRLHQMSHYRKVVKVQWFVNKKTDKGVKVHMMSYF